MFCCSLFIRLFALYLLRLDYGLLYMCKIDLNFWLIVQKISHFYFFFYYESLDRLEAKEASYFV